MKVRSLVHCIRQHSFISKDTKTYILSTWSTKAIILILYSQIDTPQPKSCYFLLLCWKSCNIKSSSLRLSTILLYYTRTWTKFFKWVAKFKPLNCIFFSWNDGVLGVVTVGNLAGSLEYWRSPFSHKPLSTYCLLDSSFEILLLFDLLLCSDKVSTYKITCFGRSCFWMKIVSWCLLFPSELLCDSWRIPLPSAFLTDIWSWNICWR